MSPACVRCCVVWAPLRLDDVCLTAPVPGVINGAPTGYATVRSWCPAVFSSVCVGTAGQRRGDIHVARVRAPLRPAVFSSVRVGTAGSVGATFMSPASVRCCAASFFHPCVWKPPGMSPCGRGILLFFHPCVWKPPAVQGRHSCRPRACVVVVWRYASRRSGDGRHKWRPYRVCRRAVVMARRFFIRACGNRRVCRSAVVMSRRFFIHACGNRRQRRGDIHVARVRAPLRCVCAVVA